MRSGTSSGCFSLSRRRLGSGVGGSGGGAGGTSSALGSRTSEAGEGGETERGALPLESLSSGSADGEAVGGVLAPGGSETSDSGIDGSRDAGWATTDPAREVSGLGWPSGPITDGARIEPLGVPARQVHAQALGDEVQGPGPWPLARPKT
eukprot:6903757-Pyramimonas_sp.AAC.1